MAKKKTKVTKKKVTKKVTQRKCAVCHKRGHNKRSHEAGNRLDPNR